MSSEQSCSDSQSDSECYEIETFARFELPPFVPNGGEHSDIVNNSALSPEAEEFVPTISDCVDVSVNFENPSEIISDQSVLDIENDNELDTPQHDNIPQSEKKIDSSDSIRRSSRLRNAPTRLTFDTLGEPTFQHIDSRCVDNPNPSVENSSTSNLALDMFMWASSLFTRPSPSKILVV
ncbi:hypothetical protein LOTGIDRAFT_157543 [Lottia gigantea]|uniref:Uncharacterized protein n=1 Tax=Lottia gigantea TaxID=225164 RepID=V4B1W6_LOTGI|nr:hypothetical protein LOTGIDRAFT_157543 [Lottia gigantea]ESP01366.1 hypothetical protein LOTGIDRAFT_157543 [Lottia gigantea]